MHSSKPDREQWGPGTKLLTYKRLAKPCVIPTLVVGFQDALRSVCEMSDRISHEGAAVGVDALTGEILACKAEHDDQAVLEPFLTKRSAILSMLAATVTLTRVDCMVVAPEATPKLKEPISSQTRGTTGANS